MLFRAVRFIFSALGLALLASPVLGSPALAHEDAGDGGVLVELFSSRACESCAPAHQLTGELAGRRDVIVLTFPVDYWNYLHPQDDLARPEFTARQKAYGRAFGRRHVYTPQIVVQGVREANGAEPEAVKAVIARAPAGVGPAIAMSQAGGAVRVRLGAIDQKRSPASVWLARFAPGPAEFTAGDAPYHNAATGLERLGSWTGAAVEFTAEQCSQGCVVIVQDGRGQVLAARQWTTPARSHARHTAVPGRFVTVP